MAQVGNRTNLEKTVGVDEQVARLDVTMKNVSGMQIFQPYNTAQQCRQLLFTTTHITNSLNSASSTAVVHLVLAEMR